MTNAIAVTATITRIVIRSSARNPTRDTVSPRANAHGVGAKTEETTQAINHDRSSDPMLLDVGLGLCTTLLFLGSQQPTTQVATTGLFGGFYGFLFLRRQGDVTSTPLSAKVFVGFGGFGNSNVLVQTRTNLTNGHVSRALLTADKPSPEEEALGFL